MNRKTIGSCILFYLLFGNLALAASGFVRESTLIQSREDVVPTVSICDLVQRPNHYEQKKVRVHGIYTSSLIDAFLLDLKCNKGSSQRLLVQFNEENWDKVVEDLHKKVLLWEKDDADVVVIGVFSIRESTYPYGKSVKYSFEISEVERVERVTAIKH